MEKENFIRIEHPLPWKVKAFNQHGYELHYIFDADGFIVDLKNVYVLNFIIEACNK